MVSLAMLESTRPSAKGLVLGIRYWRALESRGSKWFRWAETLDPCPENTGNHV